MNDVTKYCITTVIIAAMLVGLLAYVNQTASEERARETVKEDRDNDRKNSKIKFWEKERANGATQ